MRFPRIQDPRWVLAVRNLRNPSKDDFPRFVENLDSGLKAACIEQANLLIRTKALIFEDGQALIAVAMIANGIRPEDTQRAKDALRASDHWGWLVSE